MNGFATLTQEGTGAWRPSAPMAFYAEPRGFDLGDAPARLTGVEVVDLACIDATTARLTLRMTAEIGGPGLVLAGRSCGGRALGVRHGRRRRRRSWAFSSRIARAAQAWSYTASCRLAVRPSSLASALRAGCVCSRT